MWYDICEVYSTTEYVIDEDSHSHSLEAETQFRPDEFEVQTGTESNSDQESVSQQEEEHNTATSSTIANQSHHNTTTTLQQQSSTTTTTSPPIPSGNNKRPDY